MADEPARAATALVVAGGDPVPRALGRELPPAGLVVAADSGLAHARALGLHVDVVIGDFDSVDPVVLDAARREGARIEEHPAEKDATDLELAIDAAAARGARSITVIGVGGGRTDHLLANVALLAAPRFASLTIDAWVGRDHVSVVRDTVRVTGRIGVLVTLLAVHGPARGVTTDGLRYPLHDEDLLPGSTRGVSNELIGTEGRVTVREGTLLVIRPAVLDATCAD
jgi:thiamine pyrophosphokinase